ncbi:MAG TPA: L-cystine-binding protein TcyK [Firmicutes bacterium]|jgi:L-cystine transport system substrate-binding protein|nr:L-cystine-binding protein TcyK [Bacillota bacterium]
MRKLAATQWRRFSVVVLVLFGVLIAVNSSLLANTKFPKKIIVGTGNAFKPYCYLDEDGNLAGFEYEVLQEIDKRLPQYQFEYQTMDFQNILLSLDAGKIDIAAHEYAKNAEREKKYLFANEFYTLVATKITVLSSRNDIRSITDLYGKKVQVSPGSNDAYILESYNKEHGNKIHLIYGAPDTATLVQNLKTGSIDATTQFTRNVDSINRAYGDVLKTVGDSLYNSYTYHIFRKDEAGLRDDVDKALRQLKSDGTLAKISLKILGKDYTR